MNPFPSDALDANRRGELTDLQRDSFGRVLRGRNRRATIIAAVLFAAAILAGLLAPTTLPTVWRIALVGVSLGIAASLMLRVMTGGDRALRVDLRAGRVDSVTGPISKEQESAMDVNGTSIYLLRVADQRFIVSPRANEAAPSMGPVRLFYLPASRKVVNLERLTDGTAPDVVAARPLQEAIVGRWRNHFAQAAFTADGRVTANVMGRSSTGEWSVDAQGRLHAEIAGRAEVAEASITGHELRIVLAGRTVTLARDD